MTPASLAIPQSMPTINAGDFCEKLQRKMANQFNVKAGRLRTDMALVNASPKVQESEARDIHTEVCSFLEYRTPNYPPSLKVLGLTEDADMRQKRFRLGFKSGEASYLHAELDFMEAMADKAANVRRNEWVWRIANATEEAQVSEWYPFFVTLTVDPSKVDSEAMWREGREHRRYIRRLCNVVTRKLGLRPAHKTNTPESEYIRYVAFLEHGASRQHHHAHMLIWMRDIPDSWKKCPNRGIQNPQQRTLRRCRAMEKYWTLGGNKVIYFRTIGDVWGAKHGHCVPVGIDGSKLHIGTPRFSGYYITKYMQKDFKEWRHRVRATRNLGRERLVNKIWEIPESALEQLTLRPPEYRTLVSVTKTHSVPIGLIKRLAKQELFYRKYVRNQLDLKTLMQRHSNPFIKMLKSVRSGANPVQMPSKVFYEWLSEHLPEQEGYCEESYTAAHRLFADLWPPVQTVESVTIPANETR